MTLDTRILIHDPVIPPRELFYYCRLLLGATEAHTFSEHKADGPFAHNPGWSNDPGQGLPAWLFFYFGADGPLVKDECYCAELENSKCSPCERPAAFAEVSFDTAYSYRGPNGEGCGDLHAALVDRVGAWCDERGLRWSWQNEFTGEWHEGRESLSELGNGGRAASDWMTSTVLPALTGRAARTDRGFEFGVSS